jgi:hypothetical protein
VSFDKLADIASPLLFQTCAMGNTIPQAKFEFFRADGDRYSPADADCPARDAGMSPRSYAA